MAKIKSKSASPSGGGGGTSPSIDKVTVGSNVNKTVFNDIADGRDILSMFVGGGHTALNSSDAQAAFTRLSGLVGAPMAQKLTSQAFLFNQRPDVQRLTPEQRVQSFFTLGSNDADVANYLRRSGGLGTGAVDAFRNSPLLANSNLQGKYVSAEPTTDNSNVARKIKVALASRIK